MTNTPPPGDGDGAEALAARLEHAGNYLANHANEHLRPFGASNQQAAAAIRALTARLAQAEERAAKWERLALINTDASEHFEERACALDTENDDLRARLTTAHAALAEARASVTAAVALIEEMIEKMDYVGTGTSESGATEEKEDRGRLDKIAATLTTIDSALSGAAQQGATTQETEEGT